MNFRSRKARVDMENLYEKFSTLIETPEWVKLENDFVDLDHIFIVGNGGNMSIADHAAVDISRITDKNAICPGSAIVATSIISDNSFETWFIKWIEQRLRFLDPSRVLVLGISCSVNGASSASLVSALTMASEKGCKCHMVCAQEKKNKVKNINFINQDVIYYHTSEVISTMMFYQLIHASGFECPSIGGVANRRLEEIKKMEIR
jgi:hypothetical protein